MREPFELAVETAPGAIDIPMGQLRSRLGELPRDREIRVICRSGGRAYYATRVLLQNGFKASTLAGGVVARAGQPSGWSRKRAEPPTANKGLGRDRGAAGSPAAPLALPGA